MRGLRLPSLRWAAACNLPVQQQCPAVSELNIAASALGPAVEHFIRHFEGVINQGHTVSCSVHAKRIV